MAMTLKQARRFRNVTIREIANHLGISSQSYIKWEKNPDMIRLGYAKMICDYLDFDMNEIFFVSSLN